MASEKRGDVRGQDGVQNVDVPSVRGEGESGGPRPNRERYLKTRAMLSHYAHITERPGERSARCSFCGKGLAGVVAEIEEPEVDVVPGDRADEEEPAPPAPSSWWDR